MSDDGERPVLRPSIPAFAWCVAGVWVGVAAAEACAWAVWGGSGTWSGVWSGACVAAVVAVLAGRAKASAVALACAGVAVGLVTGALCWGGWLADVRALDGAGSRRVEVACTSDAATDRFGTRFRGSAVVKGRRVRVEVTVPEHATAPEICQVAVCYGNVKAPKPDERGRRSLRRGEAARISARTLEVRGWEPGLRGAIGRLRLGAVGRIEQVPGPGGALVAGVTLGDRRRLAGTRAEQDFRTTGLSHLVAVSGSHLVVVAALLAWVLSRTRLPRTASTLGVLGLTGAYVVLTGSQPSAARAWLMCCVVVLAGSARRRSDAASALAGAAAVSLVTWPPVAFDIGFQLSVLSVAGLLLFARFAERWSAAALPGVARQVAGPLSLAMVAQLATLPVAVPTFGVVSLVSPLANVVVAPLVSVVLVCAIAALATGAVWPWAGRLLLGVAGAGGGASTDVAAALAGLDGAAMPVSLPAAGVALACGVAAAAVWAWWPQPQKARARVGVLGVGLALTAVVAGSPAPVGAQVLVLDVGQGDAIVVRDGEDAALIDTGPSDSALRDALARARVRAIDTLVFTHAHDDHTGGTGALTGIHRVGGVLVPASLKRGQFARPCEQARAPAREVRAGEEIAVGGVTMRVLWPLEPVTDAAENEASIVLLVRHGATSVLLTGDAEGEVLDALVAKGALPDVDVLKVGHHGSEGAVTKLALEALKPETAVISVGEGNRFDHPRAETLDELTRFGCEVVRTDRGGDFAVSLE